MLHTRPQLVFRTASLLSALNKYLVGRHGEVSMCSKTGPTINGLHLEYRRRMATSDSSGKTVEKPDLRKASVNNKPRNVIIATCLLVIVYMYPMIFKPLFGIGQACKYSEYHSMNS